MALEASASAVEEDHEDLDPLVESVVWAEARSSDVRGCALATVQQEVG